MILNTMPREWYGMISISYDFDRTAAEHGEGKDMLVNQFALLINTNSECCAPRAHIHMYEAEPVLLKLKRFYL